MVPTSSARLQRSYHFGVKYIYGNSNISPRNHFICNRMAIDLFTSSVKINLLLYFSMQLAAFAPIYKTLFTDERVLPIPIILPFNDPDTVKGFLINLANQSLTILSAFVIFPANELLNCVFRNNISCAAAVIENELHEFQNEFGTKGKFSNNHSWRFRNIILRVSDFHRFD